MQTTLPQRRWIVRERKEPDLIRHLLHLRNVTDETAFLSADYAGQLHDPFLMKDMEPAVDRLQTALEQNEIIGVFADYDTDGTPGAALLIDGLRQLGGKVRVYIPTRTEGYGLSNHGLAALAAAGARVVVTIDLGITAAEPATYAATLGLDLIVTDHHLVQPDSFPAAALAVINPKQSDCPYPFKELCGGGIAWKLLTALATRLADRRPAALAGRSPEGIAKWSLDLAAIATICDMVPLVGENRVIVKFGLVVLAKTRRIGLQRLLAVAGVQPERVTATAVGFQLGPRINAPTRMAAERYDGNRELAPQCSLPLALLLAHDPAEAEQLADRLQQYNQVRQEELSRVLTEATERVIAEGLDRKKVIMLAGAGWPAGVVGLVASRLMEQFGRPAIVLGITGDEAIGSARSVDGLHLVDTLQSASQYLKKFGGHTKSAGLTIALDQLEAAYEQILAYAESRLDGDQLSPQLVIDAPLAEDEVTLATAERLETLAPHGLGNPRPVFLLKNYQLVAVRPVGATGRHLKFQIRSHGPNRYDRPAIGFGLAERFDSDQLAGQTVDLAVHLGRHWWREREELDLQVVDLRPQLETMET